MKFQVGKSFSSLTALIVRKPKVSCLCFHMFSTETYLIFVGQPETPERDSTIMQFLIAFFTLPEVLAKLFANIQTAVAFCRLSWLHLNCWKSLRQNIYFKVIKNWHFLNPPPPNMVSIIFTSCAHLGVPIHFPTSVLRPKITWEGPIIARALQKITQDPNSALVHNNNTKTR